MLRRSFYATLFLRLLTPTMLLAQNHERIPTSAGVHIGAFTCPSFPKALLVLKARYEAEHPTESPFQGWQGSGSKAEGALISKQTYSYTWEEDEDYSFRVVSEAEAAAQWAKVQEKLSALRNDAAHAEPYFELIVSQGGSPGTLKYWLASGHAISSAGKKSYLTLTSTVTQRPGGYICHLYQLTDDPQAVDRRYYVRLIVTGRPR